ncbi:hypothetical protein DI291_0330 [Bacillus paralicheniformis]|nr:hypothetical protein CHH86_16010 [Bacillus paralicheniformis]QSF98919.1 hypothetical protein DI291_0330 [Bacillus paralicheniformis]
MFIPFYSKNRAGIPRTPSRNGNKLSSFIRKKLSSHVFLKNLIKKLYLNQLRYSFSSLSKGLGYTASVYMYG